VARGRPCELKPAACIASFGAITLGARRRRRRALLAGSLASGAKTSMPQVSRSPFPASRPPLYLPPPSTADANHAQGRGHIHAFAGGASGHGLSGRLDLFLWTDILSAGAVPVTRSRRRSHERAVHQVLERALPVPRDDHARATRRTPPERPIGRGASMKRLLRRRRFRTNPSGFRTNQDVVHRKRLSLPTARPRGISPPAATTLVRVMVRPRRLELPPRFRDSALNAARLPIPPRPPISERDPGPQSGARR
jgi:hypothetical protein